MSADETGGTGTPNVRSPLLETRSRSVSDSSPASIPTTSPNRTGVAGGLVDFSAAAASGVSAGTSSAGWGAASGVLWAGGAALSEASNSSPRSYFQTGVNVGSMLAGAAGTVASVTSDSLSTYAGYGSAALWGASGLGSMAQGVRNFRSNSSARASGALQFVSGLSNTTAAGLSAYSVSRSADGDDDGAAHYGLLSSAAWGVGSLAAIGSAYFSPNPNVGRAPVRRQTVDDLEAGLGSGLGSYSPPPQRLNSPSPSPSPSPLRSSSAVLVSDVSSSVGASRGSASGSLSNSLSDSSGSVSSHADLPVIPVAPAPLVQSSVQRPRGRSFSESSGTSPLRPSSVGRPRSSSLSQPKKLGV